jgi:type II secretory pathway pseudopilin PulG
MKNFNKNLQSGYSIIEIFVVTAIIIVLSGVVLTTFINFRKVKALERDTELVVEVLREARMRTLASKSDSQYGVHISSAKLTIFTGLAIARAHRQTKIIVLAKMTI